MVTETTHKVNALKFLSGSTEHICRLCLAAIKNNNICLDESIILEKPYCDETVTFYEMFQNLGWLQMDMNDEMPQMLCNTCANNVTTSYLFMKQCNYSSNNWDNLMHRLDEGLTQCEIVNPTVQSIYLVVNENDSVVYTSRKRLDTNEENGMEVALRKAKHILKSRFQYAKTKVESSVTCEDCGDDFQSKYELIKHLRNQFKSTSTQNCKQCGRVFNSSRKLRLHTERIHFAKTLKCVTCDKMFSTKTILKHHQKLYHESVVCKLCFIQLPSRSALRAHADKHDVLKCPRCNKSYLNKWTYKHHLKICGIQNRKLQFFCDICDKGYLRKNGLRSHIKIDHGFGNVLSCEWCGKKFDAISRLKMHIVKHTRERNYHCDICAGKFVTLAALVQHTRLHTGEKPFPCDLCGESFLSASRRMEHKHRKHIGPKQNCSLCNAKFVTKTQLMKHFERHYNPHSKLYLSHTGDTILMDSKATNT